MCLSIRSKVPFIAGKGRHVPCQCGYHDLLRNSQEAAVCYRGGRRHAGSLTRMES
jgi:hypothetical protein